MFRRRRPLVRAAAVGGAGYALGKRLGRGGADDAGDEGPAPTSGSEAEPNGVSGTALDNLERLGKLLEQGLLTPEEFQTQKERILAAR
jgi:hypothetical protein